jgi:tetratricopeptide (TPR) repeat protein/tRNA A-37 threonylcarbamoyl transferase component Bud32
MIGQTLSHYRLLALIGRGAMGEVYAAEDVRLGRRVALKLLPAELGDDPSAAERFRREARIVSSLNHPNICTLYDIGEHGGRHFMVMELLEGEPLAARMARGALPLDQVLAIGSDVAGALDAAHRQGVVHRDVKPANLFVTTSGAIKVLDFGVAKLGQAPGTGDATQGFDVQLTSLGTAIGTVAYMSPEQARGHELDGRSDLFSLGVVIYEMATGGSPFPGSTPATIFEGILTRTPPPPSSVRSGLPGELDRVVGRALEKDPAHRYQSAADLRAELRRLQRDTEQVAGAPTLNRPAATRRARWWWLAAPAATAAVIAAVLGWQSTRTPALEARDLVVLAALDNRTGDTMFDDTLGEALAVQLRQSPFLNLVPEQRVQTTLRMMAQAPGTRLTEELGRDVCQRVGARALLTSTIAALGTSYVITLGAHDCVTGEVLAERQVQARNKEDVLRELGAATSGFREMLGESLASIKRYDAPVEAATTPSLEALKAYSQGMAARRSSGDRAALPLFRRAVELDPDFALAHARLGTAYSNLNDVVNSRRHTARAFELRDKVSEVERLYIDARYYTTVKPESGKAAEAYRVSIATYPTDYASRVNLALILQQGGDLEEAVRLLREAVAIAPEEPNAKTNMAKALFDLGRYDEARKALEEATALRDDGGVRTLLMAIAGMTKDAALEAEQLEWARTFDDPKETLQLRLGVAVYRGQMHEAERVRDEAVRLLTAAGVPAIASSVQAGTAISLALALARDRARAAVAAMPGDGTDDETADERLIVAALNRDAAATRRALPAALSTLPDDETGRRIAVLFRAIAQLGTGDATGALATIGPVTPSLREYDVVLGRAEIALAAGQWDDAVAGFTWVRDHPRAELVPNGAFSRFRLAQAYDGAGRRDDARAAYAAFLEFWKTADDDLPIVVEAKQALARLTS